MSVLRCAHGSLVPLGFLLLGLVAGAGGRRLIAGGPVEPAAESDPPRPVTTAVASVSGGRTFAPRRTVQSAAEFWEGRSAAGFGSYAEWILEAGEEEVRRVWELRTGEMGPIQHRADPATALLLMRWAELDPLATVEAAQRHPAAYASWARVDLEAALTAVMDWLETSEGAPNDTPAGPPVWTEQRKAGFLGLLAEHAPERAWNLLKQEPAFQSIDVYTREQLHALADPGSFDPEAPNTGGMSPRPSISSWVAAHPEVALRWVADKLHRGESVERGIQRELLRAIPVIDPGEVTRLAGILPPGEIRAKFLEGQVSRVARCDPDAAFAIAREEPDARGRRALEVQILAVLAGEDPRRAVRALTEFLASDPSGSLSSVEVQELDGSTRVVGVPVPYTLMVPLATSAPEETMALLLDLPGALDQRGPARLLAKEWLRYNQLGYIDAVQRRAPGSQRDALLGCLVSELAELGNDGRGYFPDFPGALRWAMEIEEEGLRNQLLEETIAHWDRMSPGEAAGFLESENAPELAREIHARRGGERGR